MRRVLSVAAERFPIAGTFTISRGSKTEAEVIVCAVSQDSRIGRGECVPYRRYGETMDSVAAAIEGARAAIEAGCDRAALLGLLPAGAARNALDCALWDLEAKLSGASVASRVCAAAPVAVVTAYTLSLGMPWAMGQARDNADRPVLKVKIGGEGDIERIRAVVEAAPHSRIILDANEGWNDANVAENMAEAAALGVALIEQPLPAGRDAILRRIAHPVPICADESVHTAADLPAPVGLRRRQHQARQGRRGDRGAGAARRGACRRFFHHGRLHGGRSARHRAGRPSAQGPTPPASRRTAWCSPATAPPALATTARRCHRPSRRSGADEAGKLDQHQPDQRNADDGEEAERAEAIVDDPDSKVTTAIEIPAAKKAAPWAAPVRSSSTVSAISFWMPISMMPVDRPCSACTPKKPATPSPSGQTSG